MTHRSFRSALGLSVLLATPALAQTSTDFDALSEGFKGTSFTTAGITISDVNAVSGVNPDGSNFVPFEYGDQVIIEKADYLYNDYPGVVSPMNVLSFGGAYIAGPNLSINIFSTVSMTTGQTQNHAEFDLLYFENGPWGGLFVHLDALDSSGAVVAQETIEVSDLGGRDNLTTHHFSISGVEFESLRLHANYFNGVNSVIAGLVDNVTFSTETSCPADMNGDSFVDNGDIGLFVQLFLANDLAADFNGDGFLDNGDIGAFVAAFLAGC